jgi:RimJ/RimL family protein N-acetyltransferase
VAESDAAYIVDLRQRAGRYLNPAATSVEQQTAWLARYFARDDDFYFVVEDRRRSRREGLVGLYDVRRPDGTAEWGRWVLEAFSNAAVESALLVYRFAFDELQLEQIFCRTLVANGSVIGFHDSCGLMQMPGEVTIDHDGRASAAIEHRLHRADWPTIEARLDRLASRYAETAARTAHRKAQS